MSKFKELVDFINSKELGSVVTRKEIMNHIYGDPSRKLNSIDTYRLTLENNHFLSKVGRGKYRIELRIPDIASNGFSKMSRVDKLFFDMERVYERMLLDETKS